MSTAPLDGETMLSVYGMAALRNALAVSAEAGTATSSMVTNVTSNISEFGPGAVVEQSGLYCYSAIALLPAMLLQAEFRHASRTAENWGGTLQRAQQSPETWLPARSIR